MNIVDCIKCILSTLKNGIGSYPGNVYCAMGLVFFVQQNGFHNIDMV